MGGPGRKPCWPAPTEATGLRADASCRSPAHASSPGSAPRDRRAKSICAPGGGMPERRRTILDLHNIESAWHLGCGRVEAWPQSAAHEVFYHAAIELERQWLPRYSLVLAASPEDNARVKDIAPSAVVAVYPNTIPLIDRPLRREQDVIIFSGTLDYQPNRTAVRHFAVNIWPSLRALWPGLKWRL